MSSGAFEISKYESNAGNIYNVKVQPETLAASIGGVNTAPAAAVDQEVSARVGGGNRQIGIKCRSVSVRLTATLAGYKDGQILRVPILKKSVFDGINKGTTGTYLETACVVVGKNAERVV